MTTATMIKLTCESCGHKEMVKEYCPFTGHRFGCGFNYTCDLCRGNLIEVKDDVSIKNKIAIVEAPLSVPYHRKSRRCAHLSGKCDRCSD